MNGIIGIRPVIKDYAWGNDAFIADLLGLEHDGPRAELWMGAHRQGSATLEGTGERLSDFLDVNGSFAGLENADSFPFLFKILAIAQTLSIQCHPDAEQARAGYEAESDKHGTVDRKDWNYQDSNPKAEMLYALTPVRAMCGFRRFEDIVELLKKAVPNLYSDHLAEFGTIKEVFDTIYRLDSDALAFGEAELLKNSEELAEPIRSLVKELGDRYFGDPGVFMPLMLNIVDLEPGQAIYLKPRVLHAYISGNGVELMNNSDNVLRAGLTRKHMDVDELEKVMYAESYDAKPMESVSDQGGTHFVCEGGFTLTVMASGRYTNTIGGPRILICTEGQAVLNGDYTLAKGQCCIVGSQVTSLDVDADGATVFMASANP
ncbi:MAG: mannose-6-phosphate isomerase, class I [Spirochaetales bacterium]|nr:mannose-6-phosphate isomerase, class I [Spirochaetales bacterium]